MSLPTHRQSHACLLDVVDSLSRADKILSFLHVVVAEDGVVNNPTAMPGLSWVLDDLQGRVERSVQDIESFNKAVAQQGG